MKSKVIIFSGIDGSGKSTHAHKLLHNLISQNIRARYIWMRGRGKPLLSFPLLVLCRLLGITKVRKLKNGMKVSEYPFYAYKSFRFLWPWLQLMDSLIHTVIHVYFPSFWFDGVLIIDRGIVDTLVDVISDVHTPTGARLLQRLFLSLLPKGSLVIVLDVNEKVAMIRKKDIPSKRYLSIRRRIYKYLASKYGWPVISTDGDFDNSHNALLKVLMNWLFR